MLFEKKIRENKEIEPEGIANQNWFKANELPSIFGNNAIDTRIS